MANPLTPTLSQGPPLTPALSQGERAGVLPLALPRELPHPNPLPGGEGVLTPPFLDQQRGQGVVVQELVDIRTVLEDV